MAEERKIEFILNIDLGLKMIKSILRLIAYALLAFVPGAFWPALLLIGSELVSLVEQRSEEIIRRLKEIEE